MNEWFEIFRAGTWIDSQGRERSYTIDDLDKIVSLYNPEEQEAPIVIGHPKSNSPAWGWIKSIKRVGDRLLALPSQLVDEFSEMLKKGLFKKRSISLYPDLRLRHVGFLGAVPPAVKGLKDISFSEAPNMLYEFNAHLMPTVGRIFRRLREWMIGKFDLETADKVVPSWDVESLEVVPPPLVEDVFSSDFAAGKLAGTINDAIDAMVNDERTRADIIAQMADEAGITPGTVNQILRGDITCPPLDRLQGFARVLSGVSVQDLIDAAVAGGCDSADYCSTQTEEIDMEKLSELQAQIATLNAQLAQKDAALVQLKAQVEEEKAKERRLQFAGFCDSLGEKLLPAHRATVIDLMELLSPIEKYEFADGDGKTEKQPLAVFQEFLKSLPKQVELGEIATKPADGAADEDEREYSAPVDADQLEIHRAAKKLQKGQKGLSYGDAVRRVLKDRNKTAAA